MSAGHAMSRLMRGLPKETLSQETFAVYVEALYDLDGDLLDDAVTRILRSRVQPWFPTIGEIRGVCAELWLDLPTEPQALGMVEARIQWGRERTGTPPAVHPLVLDALGQVGGYPAFRESEEPAATRGRFARVYREARAAAVHDCAVADTWPLLLDA